jgi:hypothetical protein
MVFPSFFFPCTLPIRVPAPYGIYSCCTTWQFSYVVGGGSTGMKYDTGMIRGLGWWIDLLVDSTRG